jgi:hypothetical protein
VSVETSHLVDVHTHFLPRTLVEALEARDELPRISDGRKIRAEPRPRATRATTAEKALEDLVEEWRGAGMA